MRTEKHKKKIEKEITQFCSNKKCKVHNQGVLNLRFEWKMELIDHKLLDQLVIKQDPCCEEFDIELFNKLCPMFGVSRPN
jgi:hypothetical protein